MDDGVAPLVARAEALAAELAFGGSSTREAGRLLHLLASQRGRARVGELGTGCGVGTAWLVSALAPEVPVVTVEADPARAAAAAELFALDPHVRVLTGDWRELMPAEAPLDLLFCDDGDGERRPDRDGELMAALLAPGGTLVMDDLPPGSSAADDPVRAFWLGHPSFVAAELVLAPETAAIVAVRL